MDFTNSYIQIVAFALQQQSKRTLFIPGIRRSFIKINEQEKCIIPTRQEQKSDSKNSKKKNEENETKIVLLQF